jgi:hypothetical protein
VGRDNGIWLLLIYFFLSVYLLPMFPHGGSANELTRWATAASIVETGSFEISWTEPLIGPNPDTVLVGDQIYSNKAPGTAVLAAPIYALTRLFIGPPDASNIRISWFLMRFFISTLPMLLLGVWLYARETDELSLATLLFATPLFVYSLLFFSHVFVAIVLYFAFRVIYDQRYIMPWHALLSGFLCGIAVISEFSAAVPTMVFGFGLLFADKRERVKRPLFFILGGLPFAFLLGWYNYSHFGSPISMSYAHEGITESSKIANFGLYGMSWPSISNLYLLLLSPTRGLFFAAPILLLSVVNFITGNESHTIRHRVKVAAIVVTMIAISGYQAADGGWAFGPRYLILVIPLMLDSFFDGDTYEMSNMWQGFLFILSLVLCVLPSLTFPLAPQDIADPYRNFWMMFLIHEGWFVPNLANVFGAPSSWWTLVPVLISVILIALLVYINIRRPRCFSLGVLTGILVLAIYLGVPSRSEDAGLSAYRATIAERYFVPAERLEPFIKSARERSDKNALAELRQVEWTIADARGYAPDDFPYLASAPLEPGPSELVKRASAETSSGNFDQAISLLQMGKEQFPFARCELSTNLANIYYTSSRRDEAIAELESTQPLVDRLSSPRCISSQFLLGIYYHELGRHDDSNRAFNAFLANSVATIDPEIIEMRKQLGK